MKKRGAIGATLTWIPAFFIIFSLLVVLMAGTLAWAVKKESVQVSRDIPSGKISSMTRVLMFILSSRADIDGQNKAIKEHIKDWADKGGGSDNGGIIKGKIDERIKDFECYIYSIEFEGGGTFGGKSIEGVGLDKYGGRYHSRAIQSSFLDRGIEIFLPSEKDRLIAVKFYGGDCKL